jgi:drug/metabolite transporter (DMT)-like permease
MPSVFILISAFLYGISPILAKIAYASGVTPLTLLAIRATLGAAFVWIGLAVTRGATVPGLPLLAPLVALGVTVLPVQVFAYFYALTILPASSASVIANTAPVHVAWMGRLFLGEALQRADVAILVVIISGAMLVAGQTPQGGHTLGFVVLGLSTLVSAFYLVTQRRLVRNTHPLSVLAVVLPCSAVVYWIAGLATNQIRLVIPLPGLLAVAGATVAAGAASLLVLLALRALLVTRAAMLGMLEPVVAVVCSVLLLGDAMTWLRAVGIVTVVGGIAALQWRRAA